MNFPSGIMFNTVKFHKQIKVEKLINNEEKEDK